MHQKKEAAWRKAHKRGEEAICIREKEGETMMNQDFHHEEREDFFKDLKSYDAFENYEDFEKQLKAFADSLDPDFNGVELIQEEVQKFYEVCYIVKDLMQQTNKKAFEIDIIEPGGKDEVAYISLSYEDTCCFMDNVRIFLDKRMFVRAIDLCQSFTISSKMDGGKKIVEMLFGFDHIWKTYINDQGETVEYKDSYREYRKD